MNRLINKPSYQVKLESFKNGGQIQKCELGDTIQKGLAYIFNNQEGTFNEAFGKARQEGQKYFRWNGQLYNTNLKNSENNSESQLDIYHKFDTRDFDEFVSIMYPIFAASFKKYNLPTTQIQNVLRQAAYESGYGTKPRGAQGYNLGGIKWVNDPNSRTYKYKHTTYSGDGIEYVDFDSLQDYANYKVHLLNDTYHALNAANTNEFVDRLHGNNPSKKSYSANKDGYKTTLNTMKSFDKAYERYIKDNKL